MNKQALADRILQILDCVSAETARFQKEAAKRGISLNALVAAAITGLIMDEPDEADPFGFSLSR